MKSSNLVAFLIKAAVLFLVFWLLMAIMPQITNGASDEWEPWKFALIAGVVAAVFDWVVDVALKPSSKFAQLARYEERG